MKKIVGKELHEAFRMVAPYLKVVFNTDLFVSVNDSEKVLVHSPGDAVDTGAKPGDILKEEGSARRATRMKESVVATVPKEVYGTAYKAIATPIFDENNNVLGTVVLGINLENQNMFHEIILQFQTSFEQNNNSIQEISTGAQSLADISMKLSALTNQTRENIKKTDKIILMMRDIASQISLLGLNASIEAARAGAQGRGFTVVADEIRRLSEQSKTSAKQVTSILEDVSIDIENIATESRQTSNLCRSQATVNEKMAADMQQLNAELEVLTDFYKYL